MIAFEVRLLKAPLAEQRTFLVTIAPKARDTAATRIAGYCRRMVESPDATMSAPTDIAGMWNVAEPSDAGPDDKATDGKPKPPAR